jgi:hypothetical protein
MSNPIAGLGEERMAGLLSLETSATSREAG